MNSAEEARARKKGQEASRSGRILHPRFIAGAKVGDLRIKDVLGRLPAGNDGRKSWWYEAECERVVAGAICGNPVKISQKNLVERGDRARCAECVERAKFGVKDERRLMRCDLDFARLRLVSDEMLKVLSD